MGFLALGAFALLSAIFLYLSIRVGSICNNGTVSDSIGSGTCSYNDGVAGPLEVDTLLGLAADNPANVSRWMLAVLGLLCLIAGGALVRTTSTAAADTDDAFSRTGATGDVGARRPATRRRNGESAPGLSPLTLRTVGAIPDHPAPVELRLSVPDEGSAKKRLVHAASSSGRVARAEFVLDGSGDRGVSELTRLASGAPERRFGRSKAGSAVESYGSYLFDAIFSGPVRNLYRAALDEATEAGTHLRLLLDLQGDAGDQPWEFLFDLDRSAFLAMSSSTSVIRFIDDDRPTRPGEPVDTLRILVMSANPRGTTPLDLEIEAQVLDTRLETNRARATLQIAEGSTFEALRRSLAEFDPHVLLFLGHGEWDADSQDGAIAFETVGGEIDWRTGRELGPVLNRRSLRLVLFNSCHAGRSSARDPFAGVAVSLVAQGLPAALGMQYQINDRSATSFGPEFLAQLAATRSIEQALGEARLAVYTARNDHEWGTPVFMTRVPVDDIIVWSGPPQLGEQPRANPTGPPE